ncbi:hypothetical protein [Luteolibacter soli]|uniref:DUF4440 domain-containing protein n=1 Tax=Luteolibacter soli TaxID=3135280 RepID=A0ABU9AY12_9BACT
MKTIRPIFATPAFACSLIFAGLSAVPGLRAEGETPTPAPVPAPVTPAPTTPTEATPEASKEYEAMIPIIKKHAELCSDAQLKMDFDKVLPYVPKKLLETMGGAELLKTRLDQASTMLKSRGVTIDSAKIGTPQVPKNHGGVLVSLVPMETMMTTPQGKIIASSHMIAISEDKGASWVFVDTATVNEDKLGTLYPALKGKVDIPMATARKGE